MIDTSRAIFSGYFSSHITLREIESENRYLKNRRATMKSEEEKDKIQSMEEDKPGKHIDILV
jgi:hypothetical protein